MVSMYIEGKIQVKLRSRVVLLWIVSLRFVVVELSPTVEKNSLIYSPAHPPVPYLGPKKGANYKETPITLFLSGKRIGELYRWSSNR